MFGRLTKTIFADDSFTTVDYDDFDQKIAETDEVGQTTGFEYDEQDRLSAVVQAEVTNPATGLPESPRTEYGYDAFGSRVSITDALGHVTLFGFDAHNRQASRTLPEVSGEPAAVESMAYTPFGDVDFMLDFKGQKADYVYDYELSGDTSLGLLRRVDYFAAGASSPAETVEYTYDAFGRRDVVTESAGGVDRVTDTDYDAEGRVTRVLNADGEIHYGYDALGRQVTMWTGTATAFSGSDTGIEYEYDAQGRLVLVAEVRRDGATLSTPVATSYGFDFAGELTSVTVSQGSTLRQTDYAYDPARGWLVGLTNKDGSGNVLSDFDYTRRVDGQITQVVEGVKQPDGSTVTTTADYTYDALNRLVEEAVETSATGVDYVKEYTLDLVGNRTKLVETKEGQSPVTTTSNYDPRDRLLTEVTGSETIAYGYDPNGSFTTRHENGVLQSTQVWDVRGRLVELLGLRTRLAGNPSILRQYGGYPVNGSSDGVASSEKSRLTPLNHRTCLGHPRTRCC